MCNAAIVYTNECAKISFFKIIVILLYIRNVSFVNVFVTLKHISILDPSCVV